jgi:integrase
MDDDDALEVIIPIRSALRTTIDVSPYGNLVYVATSHGAPFQSATGFSQWFVDQRKSAGLPNECVPHGLRKTAAAKLAEAGVGEFMLMSVMGWTNPNQARKYIEKASRAKMAGRAIEMLDEEQK